MSDGRTPSPVHGDMAHAARVLRLLAEPTRLTLLLILGDGERTAGELATAVDRPLPAVSQHLAKLRRAGLVTTRRAGTSIHYSQPDAHVRALVRNVVQHAEHLNHEVPPHHRHDAANHRAAAPQTDEKPTSA